MRAIDLRSQMFLKVIMFVFLAWGLGGCSSFGKSLKQFLSGQPADTSSERMPAKTVTYSDTQNLRLGVKRQYKRATKASMEEAAGLHEGAGSLWSTESQGAYLFSQNLVRSVGESVRVVIDGSPQKQLGLKVDVIKKLLKKIDDRQKARELASIQKRSGAAGSPSGPAAATADAQGAATEAKPDASATEGQEKLNSEQAAFEVQEVPSRIIERLNDGSYRVKGSQSFMIGEREYRVLVTGVVKAEDIGEEGISSHKMMDAKFDVVGVKRSF